MKAMLLHYHDSIENSPLVMEDIPAPAPAADEVLIKISACGICRTDLDIIEGRVAPASLPIIPGHQIVGTVIDKGSAVDSLNISDRVGITWLYSSCRTCRLCRSGRENLCPDARWTGKDVPGGFAQYITIPHFYAYPIPDVYDDVSAAPLLCAGVIGYRTLRLAALTPEDTVGIFGFGASAHIVIQLIKHLLPDVPVFVFTRSSSHKKLALTLGADWAGSPSDTPPKPITCALDFTPVGQTIKSALNRLAPAGRVVINAIAKSTPIPSLDYASELWLERSITSVANVTRADAVEFLPIAAQIPIKPHTQTFDLSDANYALQLLNQSKISGAAVLTVS